MFDVLNLTKNRPKERAKISDMEITETEQEVLKVLEARWKLGREKYGEGINHSQARTMAWLTQAIEESADMLQYLVSMKLRMKREIEE